MQKAETGSRRGLVASASGQPRREGASIEDLAVVIPVHNEEQHLGRALAGVRTAADEVAARHPDVRVRVMVVLDCCADGSLRLATGLAASDARFNVMTVGFRNVGMSRRAGAEGLGLNGGAAAARAWLANTDADSVVPRNWLVRQLDLAAAGADVVLGSVEPDGDGMQNALIARWHARHVLAEDHPHVYGANLGVRGSSYLKVGGFPSLASSEDRVLVERLRAGGARIVATDTARVLTSGRTLGRAPRGFSAYLLALAQQ